MAVTSDKLVDVSDGTVEGHYAEWKIDGSSVKKKPNDTTVSVGQCGAHTLQFIAHTAAMTRRSGLSPAMCSSASERRHRFPTPSDRTRSRFDFPSASRAAYSRRSREARPTSRSRRRQLRVEMVDRQQLAGTGHHRGHRNGSNPEIPSSDRFGDSRHDSDVHCRSNDLHHSGTQGIAHRHPSGAPAPAPRSVRRR